MHFSLITAGFCVSLGLLAYTFAGYPVLLYVFGAVFRRHRRLDSAYEPRVTLIIPAHNEEECIERKIRNSLESAYPADKLEIILASDCSNDATVKIAQQFADRIKVLDFRERGGKMGTVNKAVKEASGEILVLTDANAMFASYTISELVKYFADPKTGCVGGSKIIRNEIEVSTGTGEAGYWKYESILKQGESLSGSCVGADGSVYAVRKSLYPFPPTDRIVMDDLAVSMLVIEQGYECVYSPAARAFEASGAQIRQEFRRKARIFAGAFSFLIVHPSTLFTSIFFKFFSHKILRWCTFLFQATLFFFSFLLRHENHFRPIFGFQVVFYAAAITGLLLNRRNIRILVFHIPYYFTMTTLAQLWGFWYYLREGRKPSWEKLR